MTHGPELPSVAGLGAGYHAARGGERLNRGVKALKSLGDWLVGLRNETRRGRALQALLVALALSSWIQVLDLLARETRGPREPHGKSQRL